MPKIEFDQAYWSTKIVEPNWYIELAKFIRRAQKKMGRDSEEFNQLIKDTRHFFEKALLENKVTLAKTGPDLDAQREPIDTIVIHHTSHTPGYRLSYMEATQLLNIYAPYYLNPTVIEERKLKKGPIWSGHFRDGQQTFLCYHWLMRMDGTFERLLEDKQLGWHAGNWEINKRSIAICLDNDYENQDPTDEILRKLATFISKNYPEIKPEKIIGHCEAREGSICPGTNFVSIWKLKLVDLLRT